jgi:hypothetical protein
MKLIVLLLVLGACGVAAPPAPVVYVRQLEPDPTPRGSYLNAFAGWAPLGFEFTFDDPGMPECPTWRAGDDPDCEVVVYLFRVPNLVGEGGTGALTDPNTRAISIDTTLEGWRLAVAAAHEMGHVVLRTGRHTQGGIMGGDDDRMWDVDYNLACEAIGVCVPTS